MGYGTVIRCPGEQMSYFRVWVWSGGTAQPAVACSDVHPSVTHRRPSRCGQARRRSVAAAEPGRRDRHTACQRIINCSASGSAAGRAGARGRAVSTSAGAGSDDDDEAGCTLDSAPRITAITAALVFCEPARLFNRLSSRRSSSVVATRH